MPEAATGLLAQVSGIPLMGELFTLSQTALEL
jgi:hypothetical protein